MTDYAREHGIVRTNMYCTECSKHFVAEIDFDIDGNHSIICPLCHHEHQRVIKSGSITEDRWGSTTGVKIEAKTRPLWQHETLKIKTATASEFIREKWLNFGANV